MNRNHLRFLFRLLCAALACLLVAGCTKSDDPTASSKASSGKTGSSATASDSTGSSAAPSGVIADLPQKEADPAAVKETAAGKQSSFNVSKNGILQAYPEYDARIERDYAYTVTVSQGSAIRSLTCYNHCDAVASSDRTVNGDTYRRFCEFAFADAPVRVDIAVRQDFSSYTVMPSAKGYKSERHGNVISIYMEKPDYILLKLDDKDDSILSIFADAPETDVPQKGDPGVLYIDGWYEPDDWRLDVYRSDYTIYLAPGSVLNARVCVLNDNVTIKGRGMILDPFSNIYKQDVSVDRKTDGTTLRCLAIRKSNCVIDGIKMIDARDFNLIVGGSNTKVSNFKVLASEMCTDGITQAGGDGNSYEHVFIYNGDNGIVISGGKNQTYKDITIGSICCGIFPQLAAGEIDITDLYLFRADEGLMRNIYNPSLASRSFDIKLTNVSAVDCDHFPFIFMGGNMGDGKKTITFKNIAVPYATGANNTFKPGPNAPTIRRDITAKAATNYNLIFDGLSMGGQAITDASQVVTDSNSGCTVTVKGNGASWTAKPATVTGAVTAPAKIFIGNRQLFLKNIAVEKNGTWYVPAAGVCKALACSVPSGTTTINGEAYLSLDALKSSGCTTSATYDAAAQAVRIAAVDRGDNLLSWFGNSAHSHWSEWICYNTHLLYSKDGSGEVFYNKESKPNSGASYNLTQQLNQYGAGTYTLTMDMKADKSCNASVQLTANRTGQPGGSTSIALNTSWQKVTLTFTVDKSSVRNAALIITSQVDNPGIAFRNPVLVHSK